LWAVRLFAKAWRFVSLGKTGSFTVWLESCCGTYRVGFSTDEPLALGGRESMAYDRQRCVEYGWWARLRFHYWLAFGLSLEPRVRWLARSLALY
jgi:hypothetical protein